MSIEALARKRTRHILRNGINSNPISELMMAAYLTGLNDGIDISPDRLEIEGRENVIGTLKKVISSTEKQKNLGERQNDG